MDVHTAQLILVLYVIFNGVRVFSYVPQIITIAKQTSEVSAISLLTWWMWTGANFISGIYTSLITPDFWLAFVSFANGLGCLTVILCVLYKRKKYAVQKVTINVEMDNNMLPQVALSSLQK